MIMNDALWNLPFMSTKAYCQFTELAKACETYRYIGVCHGKPGVGKTFSAKKYAAWEPLLSYRFFGKSNEEIDVDALKMCKSVFYTATVANTPKSLGHDLYLKLFQMGQSRIYLQELEIGRESDMETRYNNAHKYCPLVIVDEADRLSLKSLEELRDQYDKSGFGLILLGMPGLEKRLSRYPQLYSRIGFVHEFKPLGNDEMRFLFEKQYLELGKIMNSNDFTDVEAMNAIMRITQGNFRLLDRLLCQIKRIMQINTLEKVTLDLVEVAKNCLVIGSA